MKKRLFFGPFFSSPLWFLMPARTGGLGRSRVGVEGKSRMGGGGDGGSWGGGRLTSVLSES